ncbi:hypothetical protein [Allopusillimonas ginsengisoli]|nr:hypothetical protein [Allopusillimonas ginsengisoli]
MTQPMPCSERNSQNSVARLLTTSLADGGLVYEHLATGAGARTIAPSQSI